MTDTKSFGSGYFGEWIEDEFGLPAYKYTCDQINDLKAISPVNEEWQLKTNHMHQVGNDRLVAVASNYGYIQVRQDEGSPKFLNDYDPENGHYAGGFGYLTDGKNTISTFYTDKVESFERTFGIGYLRKVIEDVGLKVDQFVFAPFGDDPILISKVTITNNQNNSSNLRWLEYWGSLCYQFSMKSLFLARITQRSGKNERRELSKRFKHQFSEIEGKVGILDSKSFMSYTESTENMWELVNKFLEDQGKAISGGAIKSPVKEAVLEDISPPQTFIVSLDAPFDNYFIGDAKFFGSGGISSPNGLNHEFSSNTDVDESETGVILERKLSLNAGESKTIYFAYGYVPEGFDIEGLIAKYKKNLTKLLPESSEKWKKNRICLNLMDTDNDNSWVDRELIWHNYYLRGNLTYDSFFKEHILSQGHIYQYLIGFQGAARDPLQHALPFIFTDGNIVKEVIRYTLKEVGTDGEIPYGITGSGHIMPSPFIPSDQEMWLLWLASEYILGNRDLEFLEEIIPTYPVYGPNAGRASVKDMLERCYKHFVENIGLGKHRLQRISNGDWNDVSVVAFIDTDKRDKVKEVGESVLNAAMASYTLDLYSKMLDYAGDKEQATDAKNRAENQRKAVSAQWTGNWFKRAWLTEELGWIGIDHLWLEPQPWAILGGAADEKQIDKLVEVINEKLRKPSKIGAMIRDNVEDKIPGSPGMGTNAGIWPSINGTVIMALVLVNGEMAWDEWKKNSLAVHAEVHPEVWYGIWSGPDTYNSELSDFPGQTIFMAEPDQKKSTGTSNGVWWTDFPIMNMHGHAWPLYNITSLIGIRFTGEGVNFKPTLPKEKYKFSSPLIDFEKFSVGYTGKYSPKNAGTWKITIELDSAEIKLYNKIEINGKKEKVTTDGNNIIFTGDSSTDEPLKWILTE